MAGGTLDTSVPVRLPRTGGSLAAHWEQELQSSPQSAAPWLLLVLSSFAQDM